MDNLCPVETVTTRRPQGGAGILPEPLLAWVAGIGPGFLPSTTKLDNKQKGVTRSHRAASIYHSFTQKLVLGTHCGRW